MEILIFYMSDLRSPVSILKSLLNTFSLKWFKTPTGSEETGELGVGSIPVAILSSCQDMKTFAL